MLYKIEAAKALSDYRICVRFEDGLKGTVDLADLVGKGVFQAWEDPGEFEKVYVDAESGSVAWPGGLDLAPDRLYHEIAGVTSARERADQ